MLLGLLCCDGICSGKAFVVNIQWVGVSVRSSLWGCLCSGWEGGVVLVSRSWWMMFVGVGDEVELVVGVVRG